jgi:hypothetical protein
MTRRRPQCDDYCGFGRLNTSSPKTANAMKPRTLIAAATRNAAWKYRLLLHGAADRPVRFRGTLTLSRFLLRGEVIEP